MNAAHVADPESHRAFLNAYYGWSRSIYDLTRKYYLLGRDHALTALLAEPWTGLVEVGPGTGRNLEILQAGRPHAVLGGVEPCDAMLDHARARLPKVRWMREFAERARFEALLGRPIDRVLFSYCLSMVDDPGAAVDRALESLGPNGEVVVVDFGDLGGLPRPLRAALTTWLGWFHVRPLDTTPLVARGARLSWGPGRYWMMARIARPEA
jgi:S-adenosylmethionine-diacylgycerolhomoserine-N-methlytransferase